MELRSLAAPGGLLAVCVAAGCWIENPGFLPPASDETTGAPATTGEPGTTTANLSSASAPDPSSGAPDGSTGDVEGSGAIEDSVSDAASGGDASTTTGAPDTTGEPATTGPAAVCGDAVVAGDEVCDGGPAPPLEPGACLPDCSGTIATRRIFAMPWGPAGDFAAGWDDPVAVADDTCGEFASNVGLPGEFRALLVDGEHRVAALAPYDPAGAVDWVIRPYTAYQNLEDEIVWVTGEISLLGVLPSPDPRTQPNVPTALLHPIALLAQTVAWTGLASDWTTAQTCDGWGDKQKSGTVGEVGEAVGFLDGAGALACNKGRGFVCVEQ